MLGFTVTFHWRHFFARLLKFKTAASVNIFCSSEKREEIKGEDRRGERRRRPAREHP